MAATDSDRGDPDEHIEVSGPEPGNGGDNGRYRGRRRVAGPAPAAWLRRYAWLPVLAAAVAAAVVVTVLNLPRSPGPAAALPAPDRSTTATNGPDPAGSASPARLPSRSTAASHSASRSASPTARPSRATSPPGAVPAPVVRYEAENATISQGVVQNNHGGFSGTGFVDYTNVQGSYVEWTVSAAAAGTVGLRFRYANASTVDRTMDIAVNGTVAADHLSFPDTGDWSTWQVQTATVTLRAGANTIRATGTTAEGGPDVDYLEVAP
jgi:hypothetical protein